MKFSCRLPWILAIVTSSVALYLILRIPSHETVSKRFPKIDGMFARAEYVDLSPSMRLNLKYSPIGDDGIEIEMLLNRRYLWDAYVERLGTAHSSYSHSVECLLYYGDLVVRSKGISGEVYERRNLQTGALLNRVVTPNRIQSPPESPPNKEQSKSNFPF
jgi:hypothetical protein